MLVLDCVAYCVVVIYFVVGRVVVDGVGTAKGKNTKYVNINVFHLYQKARNFLLSEGARN